MPKTAVKVPRPKPTRYSEEIPIRAYELSRAGLRQFQIAKAIGVGWQSFKVWLRKFPALSIAIRKGREYRGAEGWDGEGTFKDYVFRRLSPSLQKLWKKINRANEEKNAILKIEYLLEKAGTHARQSLFLHALVSGNFNLSQALRTVNTSYGQFQKWVMRDPEFATLVQEIDLHKANFYEEALYKLIKKGDSAATIFANRTFNRKRGYNEKTESSITISGQVSHAHAHLQIDQLDLPLEVRRQLLKAIRDQNEPKAIGMDKGKEVQTTILSPEEVVVHGEPNKGEPADLATE